MREICSLLKHIARRGTHFSLSQTGIVSIFILLLLLPVACAGQTVPATPTPPMLAKELIFYDWEDDMPQAVLDAFTEEYGVGVQYVSYQTQIEAIKNIAAGEVYDVVVMDNDYLPELVADDLLATIDYRNIPNFDNISANFRDLIYDPGNKHSVPFNWGTTALLVRADLFEGEITSWNDLWSPQFGVVQN